MANSSNVTLRSVVDRPVLYEELDANFQELIFVIDDHNNHVNSSSAHDADSIDYDNTASSLVATKVQTALDEIDQDLDDHLASTEAHDAFDVVFDPTGSNLSSIDTQAAVEEVQQNLETHENANDPHTQYARKDANLSDLADKVAALQELLGVRKTSNTGAAEVPYGTTAQRPASPKYGYTRGNTDINALEWWNGVSWEPVGSGAKGGAGNQIFVENDQTITEDYTIPSNKNASTTGPITFADGVTVTVSDGARWVII